MEKSSTWKLRLKNEIDRNESGRDVRQKATRNKGRMYKHLLAGVVTECGVWVTLAVCCPDALLVLSSNFLWMCLFVALVMRAFKTWIYISFYRRPLTRKYWIRISVYYLFFFYFIYWDYSLLVDTQRTKISIFSLCVCFQWISFSRLPHYHFSFILSLRHSDPRRILKHTHAHILIRAFSSSSFGCRSSRELFLFTEILHFTN